MILTILLVLLFMLAYFALIKLFNITVHEHRAWVYVKDNSAYHANLTVRAFGGVQSTIELSGRPLRRTWSLLAEPVSAGAQSISLLHDPLAMGWAVGDRIMIASTAGRSQSRIASSTLLAPPAADCLRSRRLRPHRHRRRRRRHHCRPRRRHHPAVC